MAEQYLTGRLLEGLSAVQLLWGDQTLAGAAQSLQIALYDVALREGATAAATANATFTGSNAARALQMVNECLQRQTV